MGFKSSHQQRDEALPLVRTKLLERALTDLMQDKGVIGIYQGGSLAKGNFDQYSDIDLHVIVKTDSYSSFLRDKRLRAAKWGEILFYEGGSPAAPYVVTHYEGFVKIDSWYHPPEEVKPSIWLQGIKAHYDPKEMIQELIEASRKFTYRVTAEEFEQWREKIFAFAHETYRAAMRDERYYALANLDQVRWHMASGWSMEMGIRVDTSYGIWSKLEGKRSHLSQQQLQLLESWDSSREPENIMKTVRQIYPEFLRLNRELSRKTEVEERRDWCERIFGMIM